jgi:hypothetical protein
LNLDSVITPFSSTCLGGVPSQKKPQTK